MRVRALLAVVTLRFSRTGCWKGTMDDDFGWLKFKPELGPPSLVECLALLGIVVCLIYAGHVIKRIWERNNELVPVPVAFIMTLVMYVVYFFVASMLYERTPNDQKTNLLMWSVFALAGPAIYYGRIIVNSCATRVIDQVSPFNMRIEEPSEFAEARKLALRRDVDGAVKRYRAYLENTDGALFEAARLLKSVDRFAEAAALFLEISERFYGKKLVWAEATYHLAKLREANLHQAGDAIGLLESILERTPESRFGQLAQTELVRMQSLYRYDRGDGMAYAEPEKPEDPFYDDGQPHAAADGAASGDDNGRRRPGPVDDLPVPAVDPFYAATLQRNAATEKEESGVTDAQSPGGNAPGQDPDSDA